MLYIKSKLNYLMNNKILVCVFLLIVLYLSFYKNYFHSANKNFFNGFQNDSEALVLANAFKDHENIAHKLSNLGFIAMGSFTIVEPSNGIKQAYIFTDKKKENIDNIPILKYEDSSDKDNCYCIYIDKTYFSKLSNAIGYQLVVNKETRFIKDVLFQDNLVKIVYFGEELPEIENATLSVNFNNFGKHYTDSWEYPSQYGLQGLMTSFLYNKLDLSIKSIQKINAAILCLVILGITLLFNKIFSKKLAICFFISVVFSPWIVSFARNLYWIEFSWFLPALFGWILYIKTNSTISISSANKAHRTILYSGIYLSIWFKCLSGYEYLSCIMLFMVAPYLYSCLMSKSKGELASNVTQIVKIGITGVLGFISALLMHAYQRSGGSIAEGLEMIWNNDVLRHTYIGNQETFVKSQEVLDKAKPLSVLCTYFFHWTTPVIKLPLIKNVTFDCLLFLSIIAIIIECIRGHKDEARVNLSLLLTFMLPAISWYVLANWHSYCHPHMNFVLWYMGGIATLLYIIFNEISLLFKLVRKLVAVKLTTKQT